MVVTASLKPLLTLPPNILFRSATTTSFQSSIDVDQLSASVSSLSATLSAVTASRSSHTLAPNSGLLPLAALYPSASFPGLQSLTSADSRSVDLPTLLQHSALSLSLRTPLASSKTLVTIPLYTQFVSAVASKGYFKGCEPGSAEHNTRTDKLLEKFRDKVCKLQDDYLKSNYTAYSPPAPGIVRANSNSAAPSAAAPAAAPASAATRSVAPPPPPGSNPSDDVAAEYSKALGNAALQKGEHRLALDHYTDALKACPNGASTHVYYSNRSAAHAYLEDWESSELDAERSVSLSPTYAKGWTRLGFARFRLKDWDGALDAYKEMGIHDKTPDGKRTVKEYLEKIKNEKARAKSGANGGRMSGGDQQDEGGGGGAGGGGMDLNSMMQAMGGMGGGGGGMASLMQNPDMMAMARQMMGGMGGAGGGMGGGNPMAAMMNNPAMMQNMMKMVESNPGLVEMANKMASENPQLAEQAKRWGGQMD